MKKIWLSLICTVAVGCTSNPYREFYHERIEDQLSGATAKRVPPAEVQLIQGNDRDADNRKMVELGYFAVGAAGFNAAEISDWQARDQARHVKVDAVIVYKKHSGTLNGNLQYSMPSTQVSQTSFSGPGLSGNGMTTSYGSQIMSVPYIVDRYDYYASFWVRRSPAAEEVVTTNPNEKPFEAPKLKSK
jgi:hypothetical protein